MNLLMNNVALALNNWFKFSVQDSDLAHFKGGLLIEISDKKLTILKVT